MGDRFIEDYMDSSFSAATSPAHLLWSPLFSSSEIYGTVQKLPLERETEREKSDKKEPDAVLQVFSVNGYCKNMNFANTLSSNWTQ